MERPSPLGLFRATLETLLAPLDADSLDEWRDAVNRHLRALTDADVVFFRLSDVSPSRVEPASAVEQPREHYRAEFRGLDPWARHMVRPGQARVDTYGSLARRDRRVQRVEEYNRRFLTPYGIHDYVGAQIGTGPDAHAHIGLFNLHRSRGPSHVEETAQRVRAVLPALQAGLAAWRSVRPWSTEFARVVDDLDDALLLCDESGRALHANPVLRRCLGADPQGHRIRDAMEQFARELARARASGAHELSAAARERQIVTPRGTYRVRSVAADGILAPRGGALVVLEPPAPALAETGTSPLDDATLHERFGLTPREVEVARLLALGHTNAQVAAELGITPNTAQSHTGRVLEKLDLDSRAGVHAVLHP